MFETVLSHSVDINASQLERKNKMVMFRNIALALLAAGLCAYYLLDTTVEASGLWWFSFIAVLVGLFIDPRYGVYALIFFGLVGDIAVSGYLPFDKNFSSVESFFYLGERWKFSPIEFLLVITTISYIFRIFVRNEFYKIKVKGTMVPATIFTAIMGLMLVYHVGLGSTARIAFWESRAIFYIFMMLVLVTNNIKTRAHILTIAWLMAAALFIEGLLAMEFVASKDGIVGQDLTEHSASIHYNAMILLFVTAWVIPKGGWAFRLVIPLLLPPVIYTWVLSDRRSAMLALFICIGLLGVYMWQERKLLFYILAPTIVVLVIGYLGAFWNSTSSIGKPAQSIKSVVAPDSLGRADKQSNLYRIVENINIHFTIQQAPIRGVGFGNPFYQLIPLPDISFFEFWEYITHNSILWIWMKSGLAGFLAMLFMMGSSINLGARTVWQMPSSDVRTVVIVMVMFLIMHYIYAYVDISWTTQSMLLLGTSMGIINVVSEFPKRPEFAEATPSS